MACRPDERIVAVPTAFLILCLWLSSAAMASTSPVGGPPPHRSEPPHVPWADPAQPPLVVTNAFGDTVVVESSCLRRQTEGRLVAVTGPKSHASWRLLDGSTLRVDEHTPAGHHADLNGDDIWVVPGNSYPRYVQAPGEIVWVVVFDVPAPVRVGVLISRTGDDAWSSSYLDALALPNGMTALTDADTTSAIECPEDGPTRFAIRLSPQRRLPFVVSWFAYEGDHLNGVTGVRRVGDRAEWRAEDAVPPRQYIWALHTRLAPGEPRLVGRVLVDPATRAVKAMP